MTDFLLPDWPAPANVRAAMTTRASGVSVGAYASLNLGARVGDDAVSVAENRRRLREKLFLPAEPVWLKQVHGANVVHLATPPLAGGDQGEGLLEADASFTTKTGVVCAVMSADCLPVLFCDDAGSVIAAAHAGWRGLAAGVLETTVRALPVRASKLMAWMGAAIGPAVFEVGAEVREALVRADKGAEAAFAPAEDGKFMADLFALARRRLQTAGLQRIFGGGVCTYCDATRFFSHRRDGVTGRMAALIWRV